LSVLTAERDELKAALEWADRMAKSSLDALSATLNQPVVPVGVSREDIARLLHAIVDSDGTLVRVEEAVDAIIAILKATDTGRE
jgi:hypothetical protein